MGRRKIARFAAATHDLGKTNKMPKTETTKLIEALEAVLADIADYEKTNNLFPNPGHADCWQSVTNAMAVIAEARRQ